MKRNHAPFCWIAIGLLFTLLVGVYFPRPVRATPTVVQVIVQLLDATDPLQIELDYDVTVMASLPPLNLYKLEGASPTLLADLLADPRVLSAAEDHLIEGQPRFAQPSGYETLEAQRRTIGMGGTATDSELYAEQWAMTKLRIPQAHTLSTGTGVIVAVLDTGVDLEHPLLVERLMPGYDFVDDDADPSESPNGLDDDGDGLVDEGLGHGTHVAGIISLVAPSATLMPVRIFNSDGQGSYFHAAQGIVYAVDHGADVLNLSGSGVWETPILSAAIHYAQDHGVIIVAAGSVNTLGYPARHVGVIAVGASDTHDYTTDFSRFTDAAATVYAPGTAIFSAHHDGGYAWWTGNSMAAPFVAGEAALLRATGACAYTCTRALITQHVRPLADTNFSGSRIDIYDAVAAASGMTENNLTVRYANGDAGSATDHRIMPIIEISNHGTTLPLSALTLRYWYTDEGPELPTFACDYAAFGAANVTSNFGSIVPLDEADRYLEVGFTEAAGKLYGGASTGALHLRFQMNAEHSYNEFNDYSYDPGKETLTEWERITLYHNGTLVWGLEPDNVVPARLGLKVQYRADDTMTTNSIVAPWLQIVNLSPQPVPYAELTARYWYNHEHPLQVFTCDYASMGCQNVTSSFVTLPTPLIGANAYLEVGFTAAAGSLPAFASSRPIKQWFHQHDWHSHDESGDYSYDPTKTGFADWERVTLYHNGQLIWGIEPEALPSTPPTPPPAASATPIPSALKVQYQAGNTNSTAIQIQPWLKIVNSGDTPVALHHITLRYWYTNEDDQPQLFHCDYAFLDCNNVQGDFGRTSTSVGADVDYLEVRFSPAAGNLAAAANSGPLQLRFHKTNWSSYDASDDYSFAPTQSSFSDWERVTLYHNGVLIWGIEP